MTLLALFVLKFEFEDRKDEWMLVGKKASDWLKAIGFKKPTRLVWMFTLKLASAEQFDIRKQVLSFDMEDLSKSARDELVCTYAALLLHDSGRAINGQLLRALVKQTGNNVSDATVDSFAKNLEGESISSAVSNFNNPRHV